MAVSSVCQPGPAGCSEELQGREQTRVRRRLTPQHTSAMAASRALAAVWLRAVHPGVRVLDTLREKQNKSIVATVGSTRFPAGLKRLCVVAYVRPTCVAMSGVLLCPCRCLPRFSSCGA